jgi:predicted TPR repeat methyltransferase
MNWYQDEYPIQEKLDLTGYDWKDKNVIDLGCNVGMVCPYVLDRGAKTYTGIEIEARCIREAKRRFPKETYIQMDVKLFMLERKRKENEVVLALGLFQYLTDDKVIDVVKNCSGDLIFEVPTGKDVSYGAYRVRDEEWYKELVKDYKVVIIQDSETLPMKGYPFGRKIFICKEKQNVKS